MQTRTAVHTGAGHTVKLLWLNQSLFHIVSRTGSNVVRNEEGIRPHLQQLLYSREL